ncbi:AAA family ATPase [Streptomyces sp. NPDC001581]|uniref:ATP-dependent nuclease n=1 Tax=Streptomyces sp. NPDC001581 TaxID=3154386 RepID=UPI003328D7EA
MLFEVQSHRSISPGDGRPGCVLVHDSWDDRGYRTSYDLYYRAGGDIRLLGQVKIAHTRQRPGPSPLPVGSFSTLSEVDDGQWFSLGQDDLYYDNIKKLGYPQVSMPILAALNDLALFTYTEASPDRVQVTLDLAVQYEVTSVSLLRSVDLGTVVGQFSRIANGGPRLTRYRFDYLPYLPGLGTDRLAFAVEPASNPPSNIHVLIGRNGVGKTTLLRKLAQEVVHPGLDPANGTVKFHQTGNRPEDHGFVNVVSVSFSAFDRFTPLPETAEPAAATHVRIGLNDETDQLPKSLQRLTEEFAASVKEVLASQQHLILWFRCLQLLNRDPHFVDSSFLNLATRLHSELGDGQELRAAFGKLSSGHAIVLLTITKLVEHVAERSLVLVDEPESHLHPPLLASFIQTLSHLLTDRNGVALIATHSPVVLQEVPRACVLKLSRWGHLKAERPSIETYGENVGVLTHEVFGLEVRESSFHAAIQRAVADKDTYQDVLDYFGQQLGGEAKALVRILLANKAVDEEEGD